MSDFKAIETQEQLDAIIGERIRRAESKAAEKYADYDSVKHQNDELTAQIADLTKQIKAKDEAISGNKEIVDNLNAKIKDYETRSVKTRIAHEVGLPYQLADKLSGEDEDAIREDAKKMASFIKTPAAPIGSVEPTHEDEDPVKAEMAALAKQLQEVF
jgi:YesN/AraC family two-component response regulator